jgi:hypothetical protein
LGSSSYQKVDFIYNKDWGEIDWRM